MSLLGEQRLDTQGWPGVSGARPTYKSPLVVRVSGAWITYYTASLSALATLTVISLSIIYNSEESNATRCKVWNYLPSISAAISCCTPQKHIWQILIGLHSAPRFVTCYLYYNYYLKFYISEFQGIYKSLVTINALANVVELSCLLLLTSVTSTDNFDVHKLGFIGFVASSFVYMSATLVIYRWSHSVNSGNRKVARSFRYKLTSAAVGLTSFLISMYFYFRHEAYCEPGVYSLFALFEYLVIFSNIAFHATAVCDLGAGTIVFTEPCPCADEPTKYP